MLETLTPQIAYAQSLISKAAILEDPTNSHRIGIAVVNDRLKRTDALAVISKAEFP